MKKSEKQKLTPARKSMIRALKLTINGNINLAKKELTKARKALDAQYA
jgi:hypothetical protein